MVVTTAESEGNIQREVDEMKEILKISKIKTNIAKMKILVSGIRK